MKNTKFAKIGAAAALALIVAGCASGENADGASAGDSAHANDASEVGKMVTTDSGLKYEVLESGEGASPGPTDTVEVHYRGTLEDGTEFDSSYSRGRPAAFPVNRVIAGWTEALQLMKVGDKWKLTIPPDLGYGARGAGSAIPPNATLIFEVELLDIK